jgi:hypothetical protein
VNNIPEDHRGPLARTEDLVVQELPDEVLVYDLRSNKAHCLNKPSALIWNHCDGGTTPWEIAALLGQESGEPMTEDAVWFALNKLSKADLLQEPIMLPHEMAGMSRRSAIRKLGIGALMVPAVMTIVAPTAMAATSAVGFACSSTGAPPCSDSSCAGTMTAGGTNVTFVGMPPCPVSPPPTNTGVLGVPCVYGVNLAPCEPMRPCPTQCGRGCLGRGWGMHQCTGTTIANISCLCCQALGASCDAWSFP